MVPAGNKAKRLSSVNHTTKTIYHHHHHHWVVPDNKAYLGPRGYFRITAKKRQLFSQKLVHTEAATGGVI